MLDIKYIRSHIEEVKKAIKVKNIKLDINELIELDQIIVKSNQNIQDLQRQKNENAQKFKDTKSKEDKQKWVQLGRDISHQISQLQSELREKQNRFNALMLQVPNLPSEDSPVGEDDKANKVIKTVGEKKSCLKSHIDLLAQNNWADFHRIAKVSGSRSYCLKNAAVLLEQALIQWSTRRLIAKGFEIFSLPNFGDKASFVGSGHFPEGEDQVYFS